MLVTGAQTVLSVIVVFFVPVYRIQSTSHQEYVDELTDAEEKEKKLQNPSFNLNKYQRKTCIYESPFSRTGQISFGKQNTCY